MQVLYGRLSNGKLLFSKHLSSKTRMGDPFNPSNDSTVLSMPDAEIDFFD